MGFIRKYRPFTWVIIVVNVLFLFWVISGGGSAASNLEDCTGLVGKALDSCELTNAGTAVGTGIGVIFIVFLWGFVDVILGVLWLITNGHAKAKRAAKGLEG